MKNSFLSYLYTVFPLVLFLAHAASAATQPSTPNYFINPPVSGVNSEYDADPVILEGSPLDLKWNTSFSTFSLWLWQQNNGTGFCLLDQASSATYPGALNWTVSLEGQFDLSKQNGRCCSIPTD